MVADQGLVPERVAKIIVTTNGGSRRRGSGYLVAAGHVLTAAHVVEDAAKVEVRFQAERPDESTVTALSSRSCREVTSSAL
ncbi:hypothetical protein [Streptomyces sp. CA-179760]|uniref:hypothetical protein n=1 Tax=Streptomyces sp. CA-179760 TaxID=3240054 RepID=UPI003D90AB3F